MARSPISTISSDLITDTGSVLWSIVQGEQLEFPITLNFLTNAGVGYTYEAVVMEAKNVAGDPTVPILAMPAGVNTALTVRVPTDRGTWSAVTAYDREDVVLYNGLYYKLESGTARVSATVPSSDTAFWIVYVPNKVYVQFPEKLTVVNSSPVWAAWSVQPTSVSPVYGFFELRVTEPGGGVFTRTWKPVRGLVQVIYSPTQLV